MTLKAKNNTAHSLDAPSRLIPAILIPLVALVLQWIFWEAIQPLVWLLFYPAVFFSSWIDGKRGGLAATAISTLLVWWFFIPQRYSFVLERPAAIITMAVFASMGVLFSFTFDRLRKANQQVAEIMEAVNAANDHLEERVEERTRQLNASEQRLSLATRGGKIGIWDWDVENDLLIWDDSMYDLYGIRKEDFGGAYEAWSRTLHPDDRQLAEGEIQAALSGEREYAPEFRIVQPDGAVRIIKAASQTLRDLNGKPLRMIGTNIDITERRRAEEFQRSENFRFQSMLDAIPDGVYIVSKEYDIEYINSVLVKEFGPVNNNKCFKYFHDRIEKCPWCKNEDIFAGKSVRWEWYSAKNERHYDLFDTPYKNNDGSISKFEIFHDITERKQIEKELLKSRLLLQASIESPMGIVIMAIDVNYRYLCFNNTHKKAMKLAYSRDVEIGMSVLDCITSDDDRRKATANYGRAMAGESHSTIEVFGDVNKTYYESFYNPIVNDKNEIIGITAYAMDITERRKAETALRESLERTGAILSSLDNAVFLVDPATRLIIECNNASISIFGYPREEMIGKDSRMLHVDEQHFETFGRNAVAGYESPGYYATEFVMRKKDGNIIQTEHFVRPLRDAEGRIPYVVSVVRDISERRHLEDDLKETNEYLNNLFNYANAPIIVWDNDFKITRFNRAFEALTHRTAHEVIGKPLDILFPPESRGQSLYQIKKMLDGETWETVDIPIITESGAIRYVIWNSANVYDRSGRIISTIMQGSDITERKMTDEKIREKDIQFRKLSSNVPDLIFQFTRRPDGTYFVPIASVGIQNIFGCSPEDVLDDFTPIGRVIFPEDAERVINDIENSAKHLTYFTCEFRVQIPGKPIQWIYSRSTPEKLPDGSVTWYGFNTDITERKQAEIEIKKLNTELEQRVFERTAQLESVNSELEAFSYSVAHDLRAPLRHIDGYVELLVKNFRDSLPDKGMHYIDTISDSARRMGGLIDDLLQFSRIGRVAVNMDVFDMNQALQEALILIKDSHSGRTIDWVIGNLPSVYGDYSLFRQVWANLLENAVKFTQPREVATIEISTREDKGEIIFMIKDNGVGFDMKYAGKLFGVFQRMHSIEEFEGTGVGLASIKRIINRHGGRIWAEAELNHGATFYFTLTKLQEKKNG